MKRKLKEGVFISVKNYPWKPLEHQISMFSKHVEKIQCPFFYKVFIQDKSKKVRIIY
jgi:hypothetical protein